jgi:hypothetical protein
MAKSSNGIDVKINADVKEVKKEVKEFFEGFVVAPGRKIYSKGVEYITDMQVNIKDFLENDWEALVKEGTIIKKLIEFKK